MVVPLLTLLAIALAITVAGLLLTPRDQIPDSSQRGIPYTQHPRRERPPVSRYSRYVVDTTRRAPHVPVRRSSLKLERYTTSPTLNPLDVTKKLSRAGRIQKRHSLPGQQASWPGIILILLSLFIFGLYALHNLLPHDELLVSDNWPDVAVAAALSTNSQAIQVFSGVIAASKNLQRINQLDPAQYNSTQQYNTWAYSTCSAAAMTEIINAYGHHYRIADILAVEAGLHEITPELGLLEAKGVDRTVARFGFKTYWPPHPTLDTIIQIANSGRPVMVGFPPDRWSGGHLLVVIGGNSQYVYTADSSRLNMQAFTHQNFLKYWAGFAVVITPVQAATALIDPPAAPSAPTNHRVQAVDASKALVRIDQFDAKQYNADADYHTWSPVDSSAAAMTEVINAYGHHYRIADILKAEIAVRGISPKLGLLSANGITHTVTHFGFRATVLPRLPLDTILSAANAGTPIIISFPPSRWPGGHLMVVTGGNKNEVFLADSSRENIKSMSRANFLKYWDGFAVIVAP
jgi:hypothetical protein